MDYSIFNFMQPYEIAPEIRFQEIYVSKLLHTLITQKVVVKE